MPFSPVRDSRRSTCRNSLLDTRRDILMRKTLLLVMALAFVSSLAVNASYSKRIPSEANDRTLVLRLTASNRNPVMVPIFEGQVLTIEDEKTGAGHSFTPTIDTRGKDVIVVSVHRIEKGRVIEEVEKLDISVGAPGRIIASSSYKIEAQSLTRSEIRAMITSYSSPKPTLTPVGYTAAPFVKCCVTCDGVRTCANCAVVCGTNCCCTSSPGCCSFCE